MSTIATSPRTGRGVCDSLGIAAGQCRTNTSWESRGRGTSRTALRRRPRRRRPTPRNADRRGLRFPLPAHLVRFVVSGGYKYPERRRRSVQKGDVRAVENPITAIFDLAEDVEARSPKIRVAIQYARIFIAFGLFLDWIMILLLSEGKVMAVLLTPLIFLLFYVRRWLPDASSRSVLLALALVAGSFDILAFRETVVFGVILVPFFVLGLVAIDYLREVHSFFEYYALRHRIVKSVRDADPVAYIPDGKDATQRVLAFLASRNPEVAQLLRTPGALMAPAILHAKSG